MPARLPADRRPAAYNNAVQNPAVPPTELAARHQRRGHRRQALGGTGALKVGADFLKRLCPDATGTSPTRAGKPPRCSNPPAFRSRTTLLRRHRGVNSPA